jgi:hypothetical protein
VFYEMLTGELPVGRFEPPSKKVEVDVRLDDVVLRTLESAPDRRYQHASDVKTEVESIVGDDRAGGSHAGRPRGQPDPARMEWHVTALGALYIASAVVGLVIGLIVFWAAVGGGFLSGRYAMALTSMIGGLVGGLFVVFAIADAIAGIGLLHRKEWARIMALVLGVLGLIEIPFGTGIGIYTLWVLLKKETVPLFKR